MYVCNYCNRHLKEDKKGATQVTPFINETSNKLSLNQTKCTFMEENGKNKLPYICLKVLLLKVP